MRSVQRACLLVVVAALAVPAFPLAAVASSRDQSSVGQHQTKYGRPSIAKDPTWATPEGWDEQPEVAGTSGDGNNTLSFSAFDDGDIVVALESLSVGHAGEWDERYYSTVYSQCVWSAVISGPGCVVRESPLKYRTYDKAYGLWVPSVSASIRAACRTYCAGQIGEPYVITSSKTDQSHWYCSKLVWASYKYRAGKDLDANGGYWVAPVDLYNDSDTSVFAAAS